MNLADTIGANSQQLNADDLIAGPRVITIAKLVVENTDQQPVSIFFEGDNGKPFKPSKSMRRVLVRLYGTDLANYPGKRLKLFRDDAVRFGGVDVGGIRISHASGITSPVTMALTDKRGSRKPYTVEPLTDDKPAAPVDTAALGVALSAAASQGTAALKAAWESLAAAEKVAMKERMPALKEQAAKVA
jgi:hypothetical protein